MSKKFLITGCNGQLGKALKQHYPRATALSREELDISDLDQVKNYDWSAYDVVLNAAAYVNADHSETDEGRQLTWKVNAEGPRNLAKAAIENNIHLIHISSEYVFDGNIQNHNEDEPFTPMSVYGQAKAAGDLAVSLVPKHHILRTSWVVGDGHNFVKTMKKLADMRIDPKVVNDQYGRLTFASELVRAIDFILKNKVKYGTYNLSNSGEIKSWADIAGDVFELAGHDRERVVPISTEEYKQDKTHFAPRPSYSDMDLSKIQEAGFESEDYLALLRDYVRSLNTLTE
ncbi:MAG: NAD(P)-dependent oxidoreductase [Pedobacter sp.]|nr:MAG: NAD(P)-dependent oxidoreductase [Pedobacter sp.]